MSFAKLKYGIDVMDGLKDIPDESIQCVVTSPPYWGLRDYGTGSKQIGHEKKPEDFVLKLVQVFREVRRVLKSDGTLWLNLGDSYYNHFGGGSPSMTTGNAGAVKARGRNNKPKHDLFKIKDLIGIPWRVALALQADGWYLRQDIIWSKPNPMPESVTDRCTKSHEYIFLLTKSANYFYNADAIKEPITDSTAIRLLQNIDQQKGSSRVPCKTNGNMKACGRKAFDASMGGGGSTFVGHSGYKKSDGSSSLSATRNKRSVWNIATKPYKGAHFATFPMEIPKICILAGTKGGGDIVLDPFSGSGTTGEVATGLGRNYLGLDLNIEYLELAKKRIGLFVI